MKESLSIKLPLYMIASTLLFFAFRSVLQPAPVFSETEPLCRVQVPQSDTDPIYLKYLYVEYSYLQPQAGDATESGSKRFIDMRNGNSWVCNLKHCVKEGTFHLNQIKEADKVDKKEAPKH